MSSPQQQPPEPLQISEIRYRRLFESARDGILILDAMTRKITDVNPFMVEWLGYSRDEFVGKELWEIGLLQDSHASAVAFRELQEKGYIRYDDLPLQAKDGQTHLVEFVSNIYDENGNSVIQCNIRDITERKRAEESLRQSEANGREAQRIAQVGSWELDLSNPEDINQNELRWSDELFRLLGYEPGELEVSNENFFRVVHPDDRERVQATMAQAIETNQPYSIDHRILWPDGSERVIHAQAEIVRDEVSGAALKMFGIGQDITARKLAEATLRENEAKFRTIFETALDAILLADDNGLYVDANPAACALLGLEYRRIMGRSIADFVAPSTRDATGAAFVDFLREGQQSGEFVFLRPDGSQRQAEFRAVAGLLPGVHMAMLRDITDRKLAEQSLQQSEARFRTAITEAPMPIIIHREDGKVLQVSKGWTEYSGYDIEDIPTIHDWVERAYGGNSDQAQQYIDELYRIEATRDEGEWKVMAKNGEERVWEFRSTPLGTFGDGQRVVISAALDFTERKRAERELQASEARKSAILETALDCIIGIDAQSRILEWNPACEKTFGYARDEVMGKSLPELIIPESLRAAHFAGMENYLATGEGPFLGQRTEVPALRKNGEEFPIEMAITRIESEGIPVFTAYLRDITERKQSEELLRESEARLRALVESLEEIVFEFDGQGTCIHIWTNQENLLTRPKAGLLGQRVEDILGTEIGRPFVEAFQRVIASGRAENIEYALDTAEGKRSFSARLSPIFAAGGSCSTVCALARDITERKQAEEALRAGEERFQSIVANVPGMVYQFILQPDGSIEWPFVSEGCRELYRMEPDEMQRNPNSVIELIHPDDRAEFDRSILASAQTLLPWICEGRHRFASGEIKWMQGASRPRRLPNGGTLWDGVMLDITARKEAEIERDRFFTLSLDMLAIADHNGYFKRLNPAFEATLGHSDVELMSQPFLEWVHPDDRAATLEVMKELDAGASILEFVNRYRCSDGFYRWLSWVAAPFEGLVYAAAHDITSLKNAQAALHKANDELELHVIERTAELSLANEQLQLEMVERQRVDEALYKNHEFLQAVLESTAEGIVACDAAGELTFFNRATREFHGLPLEPLAAEQWSEYYSLFLPDGVTPMQRADVPLFRALDGERIFDVEMVIAPRTGNARLVTNNGGPLFDADGAKLGAVVVMHDITERKQAEVKLQRARQEAETANAAKSEFLSRMSHELRTPLNAIIGFGQLLSKQDFAPAQKERVHHILKAGRHLLDLINEVLEISRIEAGQMLLSLEPVHVRKTVQEVFSLLRPLAEEHGIQLQGDDNSDLEVYVWADLQRLKQVLLNLCSNAIKYNRPDGTITVSCEIISGVSSPQDGSLADLLLINVTDTGMGLTAAAQEQLFVPFMRLGAEQTNIEGTGLGLALSRSIMHAMNGTIGVKSTVGVGSTFWLQLPLTPSPLSVAEETLGQAVTMDAEAATSSATRFTLLYIEDNLSNLRLIEAVIADEPTYDLISAMQGQIGLDLARQHHPDLILLDLHLPDILGDQVLAQLKSNPSTADIPIVMLSAVAVKSEIQRLLAAGATAYLTKPLDIALFLDTLDNILQPPRGSV